MARLHRPPEFLRMSSAIRSSLHSCPAHLGYILHTNSAQRRTVAAAATVRQSVGCESSSLHCAIADVIAQQQNYPIIKFVFIDPDTLVTSSTKAPRFILGDKHILGD